MNLYLVTEPTENDPIDGLLGQLSDLREGAQDDIDDGDVVAWAAGALSETDQARFEQTLLTSAAARELLVSLGQGQASARSVEAMMAAWPAAEASSAAQGQGWFARLRWWFAAAAAVAAALMVAPRLLSTDPAVPNYGIELRGGVAAQRGVEVVDGRRFVATSQVTLVLRPSGALGERPPMPQVFVSTASGTLRPAPEGSLREGQGGVWRFRARGDALFSGASGARALHVVFAYQPIEAEGLTAEAAKARSEGAGWYAVDVEWDAGEPR
jgi:hypothetical protein